MIALLSGFINGILLLVSYLLYKDVFSPPVLLNVMWLYVNVTNAVLGWNSDEIEYMILTIPSLMFIVGFIPFSKFAYRKPKNSNYNSCDYLAKEKILKLIFWFSMSAFLCISCYYFLVMGKYYNGNIWLAFRYVAWLETADNEFIKWFSLFIRFLPPVYLWASQVNRNKVLKKMFLVLLVMNLINSIYSTSRTATFGFISILIFSLLYVDGTKNVLNCGFELRNKLIKKRIIFSCIGLITIFIVFFCVAKYKYEELYYEVNILRFIFLNLASYTNLSSAAFVEWYKTGFEYVQGLNSFRIVYVILEKFGIYKGDVVDNYGGLFVEYNGLTTNALTVAKAYVEDFGLLYLAIMLCAFGSIHGYVYGRLKCSEGLVLYKYSLLNAILMLPLLYQILTNQYLNVLSGWIKSFIIVYLLTSRFIWRRKVFKHE